jgi:putative transposase
MQRKSYDAVFKGKLALELAKELKPVNEIATEYGVHPSIIAKWKKQLLDGIPTIFSKESNENNKTEEYEELIARLYQKIGQLEVELEWLKKKSVMVSSRKKGSYRVGTS